MNICAKLIELIIIVINNEFHRDASLKENFRAADFNKWRETASREIRVNRHRWTDGRMTERQAQEHNAFRRLSLVAEAQQ